MLHGAFGLAEGSLGQILGPRVFLAGLRALIRGNGVGKPRGNVRSLPGYALVRDGRIVKHHVSRHAADRPDLRAFVRT